MIIKIPEDMQAYENKALGNFTRRQIICLVIAFAFIAPVFYVSFVLIKSIDIAGYLSAIFGIPIIACGFIKKDGVYFEKIIVSKYKSRFVYSQKRRFEMRNFYEDIELIDKEGILEYEQENKIADKKENKHKKRRNTPAVGKKKHSTKQHSV